jgi:hypothetical protein
VYWWICKLIRACKCRIPKCLNFSTLFLGYVRRNTRLKERDRATHPERSHLSRSPMFGFQKFKIALLKIRTLELGPIHIASTAKVLGFYTNFGNVCPVRSPLKQYRYQRGYKLVSVSVMCVRRLESQFCATCS